jgi:hypothetical protein
MVQADGAMDDAVDLPNFKVRGFREYLALWLRVARSPVQASMIQAIVPVPIASRAKAMNGESIQVTTPHQGRRPPKFSAKGAPNQSSAALNLPMGNLHFHHLSHILFKLRLTPPSLEAGI